MVFPDNAAFSETRARTNSSTTNSGCMKQKAFFPIYCNDVYEVKLSPNHRFPMEKYRRVREIVQNHISSLPTDDRVHCEFRVSPLATVEELTTTHSPTYVQRFLTGDLTDAEIRNVGFPWSPAGVDRARSSVGGTLAAAVAVCEELERHRNQIQLSEEEEQAGAARRCVWGAHVAGGTHHAFYDRGEGFCVFSDIAVAANVLRERFPEFVKRILILDLDVHQGNGNAVLFQNRDDVFTFSMHCAANYFSEKQTSDLDIELPVDCNDETYMATLQHWLKQLQKHAGQFDFIFYQAGVDVLAEDRLGRMSLSAEGVRHRNQLVFDFAANVLNIPMVITMGGGYPQNGADWSPILEAHANVYIQAYNFLATKLDASAT
jgi:acetoin utilization deacetylase AcuC-like enzyme